MANDDTEVKDTSVATNDAYTGMLVVSLLALIAGSVLLYLDWSQYPQSSPAPLPAVSKKGPAEVKPADNAPPVVPPVVPPGVPPENKDKDKA